MTTPTDAISGLSERLRRTADPFWHHTRDEVIDEAATAIDALQARVKELEDECFRLAADTCHAGYGDEHGHHRCREVDQANARALRAEQERDEAIAALKPFVDVAEEMLSRGWDASNVALALDNPNEPHRVTAGDFFAIRRARRS